MLKSGERFIWSNMVKWLRQGAGLRRAEDVVPTTTATLRVRGYYYEHREESDAVTP